MAMKNIPHGEKFIMKDLAEVRKGEITSRTFAQNDAVSVTLFAFAPGEEISTHASGGDALVQVLEGIGIFTVDGTEHRVGAGQSLVMPAGLPHSVKSGDEPFKWLLTVVF